MEYNIQNEKALKSIKLNQVGLIILLLLGLLIANGCDKVLNDEEDYLKSEFIGLWKMHSGDLIQTITNPLDPLYNCNHNHEVSLPFTQNQEFNSFFSLSINPDGTFELYYNLVFEPITEVYCGLNGILELEDPLLLEDIRGSDRGKIIYYYTDVSSDWEPSELAVYSIELRSLGGMKHDVSIGIRGSNPSGLLLKRFHFLDIYKERIDIIFERS